MGKSRRMHTGKFAPFPLWLSCFGSSQTHPQSVTLPFAVVYYCVQHGGINTLLFGLRFWNHLFWQSVSILTLLLPLFQSPPS